MESILAANPNVDLFYKCSDDNVFLTKSAAEGHCKMIAGTYETVERGETKETKPKKTK